MATLEKKTLTGLLGNAAGTKLYNWLNPCCQITFRAEATCVDGQICLFLYGTSPTTQTVYLQGGFDTLDFRVGGGLYSFVANKEVLLSTKCADMGNPAEGTYTGFAIQVTSGEPVIASLITVDVPFCDA